MRGLWRELRVAARSLARSAGLSLTAILVLGSGLGAATVVYGLADAVLLHPLPYPDPDRLVFVSEGTPLFPEMSVAWPDFEDLRDRSRSFSHLAALRSDTATLTGTGDPEYLTVHMVSADLFATLGVHPELGREFTREEERAGGPPAVILDHGFWQARLGGDPGVIGRAIVLDGQPRTVVGVLPPDFRFLGSPHGEPTGVIVPFAGLPEFLRERGNHPGIQVLGRLAPGVTLAQARDELGELGRVLEQEHPDSNAQVRPVAELAARRLGRELRGAVILLLGAVLLVVLVAVVNVAGLLLARAISRQKELAVRAALGASRGALVRQLLAEALVLAGAGALLGLFVAAWGLEGLATALRATGLPLIARPELNGLVLGVSLLAAACAGALAGVLPALALSEPRLHDLLKSSDLGSESGKAGGRIRAGLVVAELALAFVLLAGATMSARGLDRLYRQDLGFDPRNVLAFGLASSPGRYDTGEKMQQHLRAVEGRLRAVPGVEAVTLSDAVPFGGQSETTFLVRGQPRPPRGQEPLANDFFVGDDYGAALGLQLVAGRFFDGWDGGGHRVALVNESLARAFFPGGDAVGSYLEPPGRPELAREIVGVVRDVPSYGLAARKPTPYQVYYALAQMRREALALSVADVHVTLRTTVPPLSLVGAVRAAIREVDPDQPIHSVWTMEDLMRRSVLRERIAGGLLAGFAAFALALASVGLYGLVSHAVARRTRELGLRVALGCPPGRLLWMIVGQALRLSLAGLGLGLGGTLLLSRVMASLVAGAGEVEPALLAVLALVLAGVAALASLAPALRAARLDPGVALRED